MDLTKSGLDVSPHVKVRIRIKICIFKTLIQKKTAQFLVCKVFQPSEFAHGTFNLVDLYISLASNF